MSLHTQSSSDSTSAEVYREGRTDWGESNYRGGRFFFVKLFIWFTPLGYVIIATANQQTSLLAYLYVELFARIKLCGGPREAFLTSHLIIAVWYIVHRGNETPRKQQKKCIVIIGKTCYIRHIDSKYNVCIVEKRFVFFIKLNHKLDPGCSLQ